MELSTQMQGSHPTPSPSGQYVASIANGKLRICAANVPERATEVPVRVSSKDVLGIRWNGDDSRIAVLSAKLIEVIDLDDASHRVRLDNGSGGLGRFASADFLEIDQLLVTWEFGKAKMWGVSNGKSLDLSDVKTTCSGERWQMRPGRDKRARSLAAISRTGADDVLNVYIPAIHKQMSATRSHTTDAQSLSWSPDGRWIAVLETPTASPSVHFYTPDGLHFRSYPSASDSVSHTLGVKSLVWSSSSQRLALTRYDGKLVLLNTRTFTPLAIVEHTTTVDQRSLPEDQQAPRWQESVAAFGERSYTAAAQPVSPPLSKTKQSTEPSELGVAEACFSADGSYLATRDERMLNTVWIWSMTTLAAHAVLIQHSNIRKLHWHPARPSMLMADCGEGIAYLFDASASSAPVPVSTLTAGAPTLSWIHTTASSRPIMLAATKASFRLMYPEGQPEDAEATQAGTLPEADSDEPYEEGASEDSLFDVLSGRKPLHPKTEQSYTEMIDVEVETEEEDITTRMDDTFREKRTRRPVTVDPLDDSQIF